MAGIPVLSNPHLIDKLDSIRKFAGINIQHCGDESSILIIEYMNSWLMEYENQQCDVQPPTWSKFLESLRLVNLHDLTKKIEECLKKAPESDLEVEQAKSKEGLSWTINFSLYSYGYLLVG